MSPPAFAQSWSEEEIFSSTAGSEIFATAAAIAFNDFDGQFWILYEVFTLANLEHELVLASYDPNTDTLVGSVTVVEADTVVPAQPTITVDNDDGTIHLLYSMDGATCGVGSPDDPGIIVHRTFDGTTLSGPTTVYDPSTCTNQAKKIAVWDDPDDEVHLCWTGKRGAAPNEDDEVKCSDFTGSWSAVEDVTGTVNDGVVEDHAWVVPDSVTGERRLVWHIGNGAVNDLTCRMDDPTGMPAFWDYTGFETETPTTNDPQDPSLAYSPNDSLGAVWEEDDESWFGECLAGDAVDCRTTADWEAPEDITNGSSGTQVKPELIAANQTRWWSMWERDDGVNEPEILTSFKCYGDASWTVSDPGTTSLLEENDRQGTPHIARGGIHNPRRKWVAVLGRRQVSGDVERELFLYWTRTDNLTACP